MSRKRIEKFSKELMANKLVYYQLYGDSTLSGIGRIVYEETSETDEEFYILQNTEDGAPTDIKDSLFKFSVYYYPNEVEIWELTGEEEKAFLDKVEVLKKLEKGSSIYINGDIRKITKKDKNGDVFIDDKKLEISDVFNYIENPETFYRDMYKSLLECEYINPEYRKDLEHYAKSNSRHTGAILFTINGVSLNFRHQGDGTGIFEGISAYNPLYAVPSSRIKTTGLQQTIGEVVVYVKETFGKVTYIGKSLYSVIQNINCEEEVKNHLLAGDYYHNMQFIDYDEETKMISYIPKGKELIYDEKGILTSKNRQTVKPHKFFNTVLKGITTEYEIKCFADKLIAFFNSWTVKYFKGKKFAENYSRVNTRTWTTQSCMDRKAENFFELYTQSPFRLGVIYREGEEVGRFIEVTTDDKFVYNDRLYYKDETVQAWYNSWCDKSKLNRKERNSQDSKESFYNSEKGVFKKKVTVTLKKKLDDIPVFPYLDTLTYGYRNKIQNFDSSDVRYQFTGTSGKASRVRCKIDIITKRYIDDNVAIPIGFGVHKGEHTTVDRLIYSAENQAHCLK